MVRQLLRRGALAGAVVLGLEAAYAVLRPAPDLDSFDPSGEFGEPDMPTLRIAVLGDSSVTAPGVAGPEEIWVSRICQRLADTHHVILASFAVGGSMAHDLIKEQLPLAIDFEPDIVLVAVGANDAIKGVPVRVFEKNLDKLIAALTETGATVIQSGVGDLGSIPRLYPPLENLMSRRALRFDRAHQRVGEKYGTTVVDQRSDDPDIWYATPELWAPDLFHVSSHGHERWADTAWKSIAPLVARIRESV